MRSLPRLNFWQQWRHQLGKSTPLAEVENSMRLRVLVLGLVLLGIVATDVAAETQFSFWAVPLSIVGAMWSWYSRTSRNISVKFCLAIGMLFALGAFFRNLLGDLNDTRLVLAELLIQLQVLHSFDMPRRKDLGYSIVIGIILLGVAATLSQTLAFAPVVLLFVAIALPTMVLDYRSRLGLGRTQAKTGKRTDKKSASGLSFYFFLFTTVVGLGLAIFAVLPRVPGYQMRIFPVSAPIQMQGEFSGRSIINPGYTRPGNQNNQQGRGSGTGQGSGGQPGKLDETFYYGFNTQINQNLRGQLKPQVVMRVRSQAEGFWRVLGFDRYTGKGWEISRNDEVQTIQRPAWSYQIYLNPPLFAVKTREVVQTYTIVSELPNLVPALASAHQIFFPTPEIAVDTEGGLRAPVGLSDGLTYTVISEVPERDRTQLQQAATKYSRQIRAHYLQIPPEIAPRVRQQTQQILDNYNRERVGKSEKALTSPYEIALYLAQYLKQRYTIPDDPFGFPYLSENEDLVEAFLFKYKGGYPDHFSTVLTVMLRSIGIPARLVAGYGSGQFNPFTGMYIVRNTDAYAMTEVYFPKYGWFAFDPIPGHPLIPPSIEENQTFSVLRAFWSWVAGWLPSPVTGVLNQVFGTLFTWIGRVIGWFIGLFSQGWFGILTGLGVSIAIAFLSWLAWQQWQRWRYQRWLNKLPPMENLYQQMLTWTAAKGLGKHPAQTPLEYAHISSQHHPPATAAVIADICRAYVGWRYGGHPPNLKPLQQRWQQLQRSGKKS